MSENDNVEQENILSIGYIAELGQQNMKLVWRAILDCMYYFKPN